MLAWLLTQPPDPARRTALGKLTDQWVRRSPAEADAFLKAAVAGDVPEGLPVQLAGHYFSKGASSALAWARGMDGAKRAQAMSAIFYRAGGATPPDETVGLIRRLPVAEQDSALQAVLHGSVWQEGTGENLAAALPAPMKASALR